MTQDEIQDSSLKEAYIYYKNLRLWTSRCCG